MDFTLLSMTPWFPVTAGFLFLSCYFFFTVNSAWADKIGQPKGNRIFITLGVISALITLFCAYKVIGTSTGTGG